MPKILTKEHDYEELRAAVLEVLAGRIKIKYNSNSYQNLVDTLAGEFFRRGEPATGDGDVTNLSPARLNPSDQELVRDVFWDLSRQGYLTLGGISANEAFRLSRLGEQSLKTEAHYLFHSTTSYIALVQRQVPDILPDAVAYLGEAADTFYAGCLFSSSVMLGVAAEIEFNRLTQVAAAGPFTNETFKDATTGLNLLPRIETFRKAIEPLKKDLKKQGIEGIDTKLFAIQDVIRIARNETGHAKTEKVDKYLAWINLTLFIHFAEMAAKLRLALK